MLKGVDTSREEKLCRVMTNGHGEVPIYSSSESEESSSLESWFSTAKEMLATAKKVIREGWKYWEWEVPEN